MESEDDESFLEPTEVSMDRISELPDEVLSLILSSLLTREAARTCVLSRRWKDLWKFSVSLSSSINLDVLQMRGSPFLYVGELPTERDEFVRWVDTILQLHHSPVKESIKLCASLVKNHAPLIDQWIQLAIDKRVQNYHIDFSSSCNPAVPPRSKLYTFPYWLFTQDSGSLVKCLFLKSCAFGLRDSNIFTSLRDLHLEFGRLNESKLHRILSNCPSLEKLGIINCTGMLSLEISGNSLKLKHLTVVTNHPLSTVMIDAQNLTTFHFVGNSRDFLFRNAPQLSNVSISANTRLSYDLGKLSIDMPKLEFLALSIAVVNDLVPNQSSMFANLKKLNLTLQYNGAGSLWGIIPFVQACPYLQTFELHTTCGEEQQMQRPTDYIHQHLREVILEGFICHSHDMDFVTYLLINAIALEKLIFIYQTRHSNLTSAESSRQRIKVDANACEQLVFVWRWGSMHVMWSLRGERPVFIRHGRNAKLKLTIIPGQATKDVISEEEGIEALSRAGIVGGRIRTTTDILKELKRPEVGEHSPSPPSAVVSPLSASANVDDWKFVKDLIGLLFVALNALVIVIISAVVKVYLL